MTIDELYEIEFTEANVLNYYDEVKEFFTQPIDDKTIEEEDIVSVLVEFEPCLESLKDFARIIEFEQTLKEHNPKIHEEYFPYTNLSLCQYFCYKNNVEGLEKCVNEFVEYPLSDYDLMMKMCRKILAYEHIDLVDRLISETYEPISKGANLIGGAEFEMALLKGYIELEKVYFNHKKTGEFDWEVYKKTLPKFGFEIGEEYIKLCELGLEKSWTEVKEDVEADYMSNRQKSMETLQKIFMKYMYEEKNMRFPLSAIIWDHLYEYWEREGRKKRFSSINNYFDFKADDYKEYVTGQSGMILDYRFLSVVILWGTCHVFDFLKKIDYVQDVDYQKVKDVTKQYKEQVIKENLGVLWHYSYVNDWQKSDMETDEEKQGHKAIFDEYYEAEDEKIRKNEKEGFFIDPNHMSLFDRVFSEPAEISPNRDRYPSVSSNFDDYKPAKVFPKIGRNEKVTVEYEDGTIKKDVKYKKVQKDVEAEKCKVI